MPSSLLGDPILGTTWEEMLFLIPSLVILLAFYSRWSRYTSLFRAAGSVLFGLFWATQVPVYLHGEPDIVNAAFCAAGALLFLFIALQLYFDHAWNEQTLSVEWLLRMSALTASFYFVTEHIPIVQGAFIFVVAHLTYRVLALSGSDVAVQSGFPTEVGEGLAIFSGDPHDDTISIVFACTAALAIFLFAAAIVSTRTDKNEWLPWARKELKRTKGTRSFMERTRRWGILNTMRMSDRDRKIAAFLATVPLIFVVNIFRNVGVIVASYGDLMDFYTAHNIVAKVLSLVMMMFLTWVLFEYLPELQENMVGLFDLRMRFRRGMIKNGRVEMKYVTPSNSK